MLKVVVSGGGTGGHIYPAIAIAREVLQLEPETRIVFIGGKGRRESAIVPGLGFDFVSVPVESFPRKLSLRWFKVARDVPLGLLKSLMALKRFHPQLIIGTGGYVCGPALLGAALLHIPIVIQEQNALPGVTNRIMGRWADEIHVPFEAAIKYFPPGRTKITGNPVRPEIVTATGDYEKLGLDKNKLTILFMGGSQGAKSINAAAVAALERLGQFESRIQIIHQTGKQDFLNTQKAYDKLPFAKIVQPYYDRIQDIYAVTDLAVCRSGAMTLAELAARGLPSALIPYPYSAEGHQAFNAKAFEEKGAAIMIRDAQLTGESLANILSNLIQDREKLSRMAEASRSLGKPEAARKIACSALSLIRRRVKGGSLSDYQYYL